MWFCLITLFLVTLATLEGLSCVKHCGNCKLRISENLYPTKLKLSVVIKP